MTTSFGGCDGSTDTGRFLSDLVERIVDGNGTLPAPIEAVQERLIRRVGRVRTPGGDWVYLKSMHFPRPKDRLRYLLRALPGPHEARMLETLNQRLGNELPGPRPLLVQTRRRGIWPDVSVLALSALPVVDPPVDFEQAVTVAARLAQAGIEHRDLHGGNVVRLADGGVGVLDLQSARARSGSLGMRARRRLAAKLLQGRFAGSDPDLLVASGLVTAADRDRVLAAAECARRQTLRRRLFRCLRTSTEFRCERRGLRSHHWRREVGGPFRRLRPDQMSVRELWLGDRIRELLDREPPLFAGASFRLGPGRGGDWLYIAESRSASDFDRAQASLIRAYERCFGPTGRLRSAAELRSAGLDLSGIE